MAVHLFLVHQVSEYLLLDQCLVLGLEVVLQVLFLGHVGVVIAVVILLFGHEWDAELVDFVLESECAVVGSKVVFDGWIVFTPAQDCSHAWVLVSGLVWQTI